MGLVHDVDWSNPPAWIAVVIGVTSLFWAERARKQSKRSADAASRTIELAEMVEQRKRHGWALELRDGQDGLILRNTGTLDACAIELAAGESQIIVMEEGYPRARTEIVRGGQGKAIQIHRFFSDKGGANELTIEWQAEGETGRRIWVEPNAV